MKRKYTDQDIRNMHRQLINSVVEQQKNPPRSLLDWILYDLFSGADDRDNLSRLGEAAVEQAIEAYEKTMSDLKKD
jgi:hypothetical protein